MHNKTNDVEIKYLGEYWDTQPISKPFKATEGSAGFDLVAYTRDSVMIGPGKKVVINTGIAININNPNIVAKVYVRSGLARRGVSLANGVGIIDSDYQGEILLIMINTHDYWVEITPFKRVAQMVFEYVAPVNLVNVDEFSTVTERGDGGFGSTGS